jgi:hypothetical protein
VLAGNLTAEPLRRALRGRRLPRPQEFLRVSPEMLDAIAEAGPLKKGRSPKARRKGER